MSGERSKLRHLILWIWCSTSALALGCQDMGSIATRCADDVVCRDVLNGGDTSTSVDQGDASNDLFEDAIHIPDGFSACAPDSTCEGRMQCLDGVCVLYQLQLSEFSAAYVTTSQPSGLRADGVTGPSTPAAGVSRAGSFTLFSGPIVFNTLSPRQ